MPANSIPSDLKSSSEQMMDTSVDATTSNTARLRTESEGSDNTSSLRFFLPSLDGSSPKVLTLSEISHVFDSVQNMELAHEIALNPEFKLQPYDPPENSLEDRIKKIIHQAFWDILRADLNKNPPCFEHAIKLLNEIKECFPQILSQNNERALNHINEVLDPTVIRQQAEHGVLDFKAHAEFIIDIMSKSCAPVRDEAIANLREIHDVVDTFKGILDTMSLMKLDMVNYLLDKARNDILANSVEFEREKFRTFLQYCNVGFPLTENWLKSNTAEGDNNLPAVAQQTIINAYWALMDWEGNEQNYPEVLYMDKERIFKLSCRAQRLCLCASLISVCAALPVISQRTENRNVLAKHFTVLLDNVQTESEVPAALENVWEQVKLMVNNFLKNESQSVLDSKTENLLMLQIQQLKNKDTPVRKLMYKRLQQYINVSLRTRIAQLPIASGYVEFSDALVSYATAMKRIIAYNHSVFGEFFMAILTNKDSDSTFSNSATVRNINKTPDEQQK